jgi:hypothetical protein
MTSHRLTVQEAAEVLDTSVDAVRMRVRRGSLASEKGQDGRVYVWLDDDESNIKSQRQVDGVGELIDELRDRVCSLERRLDEEQESRRRADTIIAQLTQANAALAARVPELEAPQEPSGGLRSAGEGQGRSEARADAVGVAQEAAEHVPWWRRVFGQ